MMRRTEQLVSLAVITAAFLFAAGLMAVSAQSDEAGAPKGVVFPIAELGDCTDKESCQAYCNEPANIEACIEFGRAHGLVNKEEAERGKKFAAELKGAGGPGGCKTPAECKAYCESVTNLSVCIEFAKKHKIHATNTGEADKLAAYLAAGGTMPGGCTTKDACEAYCSDFAHAEECRTFAEKAGLAMSAGKNLVPPGQFQKFIEAVKNGRTPGGCTSADSCRAYCSDAAHRDECLEFGKEAGLLPPEQADRLKGLGRTGPGGCDSAASCRAYCDNDVNREACFKFAEEHGLISPEKLKATEEGLVRFRQGLDHAPADVVACLKSNLGETIIADIQAGKLIPGPDIGERVKGCFEKFGRTVDTNEEWRRAPKTVISCLKEKVGAEFTAVQSGDVAFTPDMADALRVCAERMKLFINESGVAPKALNGLVPDFRAYYERAPQEVQACIKEKLGGVEIPDGAPSEEVKNAFRECYSSFKPMMRDADPARLPVRPQFPSAVAACLTENLPPADAEKALSGASVEGSALEIVRKCMALQGSTVKPIPLPMPIPVPKPATPSTVSPFRPAVLSCLKDNLSVEDLQRLLSGVKTERTAEILAKCQATGDIYVPPPADAAAPAPVPYTTYPVSPYDSGTVKPTYPTPAY